MIIILNKNEEWADLAANNVANFFTNYTTIIMSELEKKKQEADSKAIVKLMNDDPETFSTIRNDINTAISLKADGGKTPKP